MTIAISSHKGIGHLLESVGSGDVYLKLTPSDAQAFINVYGDYIYALLRGPINREIVKIDIAASALSGNGILTVARGQGGTSATAWPVGTLVLCTTNADHYNAIIQRGEYRQIAYNPNEILTPLYAGEKIYQTGPAGCERWWKAFNAVNPYWDIITGAACGNETYQDIGWTYDLLMPIAPEEHILMVYTEAGDGCIVGFSADWATARGTANEAFQQSNNETGAGVNNVGSPYYIIGRTFYEFDLSFFDGVDRTITDISLDLVGFSRVESSFQAYSSIWTGVTALADYNKFGSTVFFDTPQTLVLWDGGNPKRNVLPLNAAGLAYIATKYSAKAAFCLREYPHDVLDVAPTVAGRNGLYFKEIGYQAYQKYPRLILTYNKVPNWVQKFGPTAFSITNGATWDGVKYTSVGNSVNLAPVGTWFKDERPIKVRIEFQGDGDDTAWIEMFNTDGYGDLFDDRNQVISDQEIYINNYGNFDLEDFYIFIDTGATITNIEFLYP